MKPHTSFLISTCIALLLSSNAVSQTSAAGAGTLIRIDPAMDALVPADARIEKLSGGFAFTEGPVWHRRFGHLMFSDLRSNAIHIWDDAEGLSTFMQPVFEGESETSSVGSNGLNIDSQGRLILMEHGNRRVSRMENGNTVVLADNYQGLSLIHISEPTRPY